MKVKRIGAVLVALGIELFAFHRLFSCWLFKQNFYFTPQDVTTHVTNDIHADQGIPVLVVRIIHNKVFELVWGLLQALLQYWDIRFLEEFIGVVGGVGVGLGVWYFFTKDRGSKIFWIVFLLGIILPIGNAFFQPHIQFAYILVVFGVIFQAISLYGLWKFLEPSTKGRYIFFIFLCLVSILFLALFPLFYQEFCLKM